MEGGENVSKWQQQTRYQRTLISEVGDKDSVAYSIRTRANTISKVGAQDGLENFDLDI